MSDEVIVLSDSAESEDTVINDNIDVFVPSFGFHDHDLYEAESLSDATVEEVKKTDRAGRSRFSELLLKYNDEAGTTKKTDNRKKNNDKRKIDTDSVPAAKQSETSSVSSTHKTKTLQFPTNESSKTSERQFPKNLQPGECLKFVKISIDEHLTQFDFHLTLVNDLIDHGISYKSVPLPIPNSIMWKTEYPNENHEMSMENIVAIIWNSDETMQRIRDGNFASSVENVATLMPDKKIMLVIYGMGEYFRYRKKSQETTEKRIRKEDLEMCLTEVQLVVNCCCRLVDTSQELSMFVYQLTKAIAEKPLKLEKRRKLEEKFDWYATGDNRDTVKVDKNGNGLKRLWQQQLCQFNLASLETAEAITSVYPSPFLLMRAYKDTSILEGEKLLSEIPIRRAAGPLSSVRKIGPELSKKIFIAFTSEDGNTSLANDRDLR